MKILLTNSLHKKITQQESEQKNNFSTSCFLASMPALNGFDRRTKNVAYPVQVRSYLVFADETNIFQLGNNSSLQLMVTKMS